MANMKAAKKRMAQDRAKHMHSKAIKSEVRTQLKKTLKLIRSNGEDIDTSFKMLVRLADKAVTKGVYHRNTSARIKSRVSKQIRVLRLSTSSNASIDVKDNASIDVKDNASIDVKDNSELEHSES